MWAEVQTIGKQLISLRVNESRGSHSSKVGVAPPPPLSSNNSLADNITRWRTT